MFPVYSVSVPQLSYAKWKEGIFDGPQIRKLLKSDVFYTKIFTKSTEKRVWLSFKNNVEQFLGNVKSSDGKKEVSRMVDSFQNLKMNLKLHFMDSDVEYFPENLGDYGEEQSERFNQDIKVMDQRCQGR